MSIGERATARFADLRRRALDDLASGRPAPGRHLPPDGWCVSTVARIVDVAPSTVPRLATLQRRLDAVGEWQHYGATSLHLSLLGCTQREPDAQLGQVERLAAIEHAVDTVLSETVLADTGPVTVMLGRLGLIGAQAFVEVVPADERWATLRRRVGAALVAIGEAPMTHPDPEPIHLNVARLHGDYDAIGLGALLRDATACIDVAVDLACIELVVTDFALTPGCTTRLRQWGQCGR
jgi:hypothetical protein